MMPCCRIESINSSNASRAKSLRGCNALGTMVAKSIWCTLSANSSPSLRAATEGVPISAPRPLPRPDRAMRLRLPELPQQRKQQSAPISPAIPTFGRAELYNVGGGEALLKKNSKKSIDIHRRNSVSTRVAPKTDKGLLPGRVFCLFGVQ